MRKAIVLSGVGGVGKTHTRLNDFELKNLPLQGVPAAAGDRTDWLRQ